MASEKQIVLVTPVWNDSIRLGRFGPELAQALASSGLSVRWIVSDDGSSALEKAALGTLVDRLRGVYPQIELQLNQERVRKGGAIYRAWDMCTEADILAFVDADGAIDAASVLRLLSHASMQSPMSGVVGIRHNTVATPVQRPWQRAVSFRVFTSLVRRLIGIDFEDTQCGIKVVPAAAYHTVAANLMERGFVFDVELLLALQQQGCQITELRIPWREIPEGKVRPLLDAWGMIAGLLRIRQRAKAGQY